MAEKPPLSREVVVEAIILLREIQSKMPRDSWWDHQLAFVIVMLEHGDDG